MKVKAMRTGIRKGKPQTNFVKPNRVMQLADIVSVAKIKNNVCLRAHSWRSCAFTRRPMAMPALDYIKSIIFSEQASQINVLFRKRKKKHIDLDSVETNWNIWESTDQVRVKRPTSPRR